MALKDKMLVGHVFIMVIRKSIEWSTDSQFQCENNWQEKRNFDFACYRAIKCQFLSNVFFDDLASQ